VADDLRSWHASTVFTHPWELFMLDALDQWTETELRSLADRLRVGGLTPAVLSASEAILPRQFDAWRAPVVRQRLAAQGTPAADLARLFLYDDALDPARVSDLLNDHVDALLAAGVLVAGTEGVRSRVRITPVEDLLILHDPPHAGGDAVMGPGATTLRLWRSAPVPPESDAHPHPRMLDLGCGAGSLALLAAGRGWSAVATDVSERAARVTRVNSRLNGVTVDVRCGDVAAPVSGESFDLILAQPPFVLAPPDASPITYLHGGERGDGVTRRFLREIPTLLVPGGVALLHLEGPVEATPLPERLRAMLPDPTPTLIVLRAEAPGADAQAAAYASLRADTSRAFAAAVRGYLAHFDALGVDRFESALVVLRRPEGTSDPLTGLTLGRELPASSSGPDASMWRSALSAMTLAANPESFAGARLRRVDGTVLEERRNLDGTSDLDPRLVYPPEAGIAAQEVSPGAAQLLAFVDGERDVAGVTAAYATHVGAAEAEVRDSVVSFLRNALLAGLVRPPVPHSRREGE
jgi:SAM-dependent methyltransferase